MISFDSSRLYPLVVAPHPSEPNQFALGLTDGGVHVLEPLEPEPLVVEVMHVIPCPCYRRQRKKHWAGVSLFNSIIVLCMRGPVPYSTG